MIDEDIIKFPEKGWFQSWWYTSPNGQLVICVIIGILCGIIVGKIIMWIIRGIL